MERYEPNVALPESGNCRDISKWRSQKSVWVPFIITLDMSVWDTLKTVLDKDSAKDLYFQLSPSTEANEEAADETKSSGNADETGTLFVTGISSRFVLALIILFYSLLS